MAVEVVPFKPKADQERADWQATMVAELRDLVAKAEAGTLTGYVGLFVIDEAYECQRAAGLSRIEGVALASMLQAWTIDKVRAD